jgi:hypothetical protein
MTTVFHSLLVALLPIPRSEQRDNLAVPLSLAALVCFSAKADVKNAPTFLSAVAIIAHRGFVFFLEASASRTASHQRWLLQYRAAQSFDCTAYILSYGRALFGGLLLLLRY